jgi:hypothetical protein
MRPFRFVCFLAALVVSLASSTATAAENCSNVRTWIPPGSTIWRPAPNIVSYRPPSGYTLVRVDGTPVLQASHTCDCSNTNGGCNPVVAPNGHTSCDDKNCEGGCSGVRGAISLRDDGEAVTYASRTSARNLPQAIPELLSLPTVRAELAAFLHSQNGPNPPPAPTFVDNRYFPPAGYAYTLLDVRGYLVTALVAEQAVDLADAVNAVSIACTCKRGTGCVAKTGDLGVQYCDAGECKSCRVDTTENLAGEILQTEYGF